MNEVLLSGILTGEVQSFGDSGAIFKLVVTNSSPGGASHSDEFMCMAFGVSAPIIKTRANSGDRVILQGRIDRDKMGGDKYHTVVVTTRILGVAASETGIDVASATVGGLAEVQSLRTVGNGTNLLPLSLKSVREFKGQQFTTYVHATAWSEQAAALSEHEGRTDVPMVIQGMVKPRTYEDKDGDTIHAMDVWVNSATVGGDVPAPQASSPQQRAQPPANNRMEPMDSELPF